MKMSLLLLLGWPEDLSYLKFLKLDLAQELALDPPQIVYGQESSGSWDKISCHSPESELYSERARVQGHPESSCESLATSRQSSLSP